MKRSLCLTYPLFFQTPIPINDLIDKEKEHLAELYRHMYVLKVASAGHVLHNSWNALRLRIGSFLAQ